MLHGYISLGCLLVSIQNDKNYACKKKTPSFLVVIIALEILISFTESHPSRIVYLFNLFTRATFIGVTLGA